MADYIDLTTEEVVASLTLLGYEAPPFLFGSTEQPDEHSVEVGSRIGRRILIVRGFVTMSPDGAPQMDGDVGLVADLIDHGDLAVAVLSLGEQQAANLVFAGGDDAVVLSLVDEGIWRIRLVDPADMIGVLSVLTDLDKAKPAGSDAETLTVEVPEAGVPEAARVALAEAVQAVVGADSVMSIVSATIRSQGSESNVIWTSSPDAGLFSVRASSETTEVVPSSPDLVAAELERLLVS